MLEEDGEDQLHRRPEIRIPFHSMYGATAPSGPWTPSKRASTRPCFQLFSSIPLLLAAVMHSSEPRLPIWFLVFPLVLCCGREIRMITMN